MSSKSSTAVGLVIALLIIGAVATLGYYQFEVAAKQTSTSTSTAPAVTCPSAQCANVTIASGASSPPPGYSTGQKTTYGFTPDVVTVVIGVNNTIFWTNNDASIHTATSDTTGLFDTGNIDQGQSAQVTLTTPGTYTYHCTYHSWMQGTIVVKAAPTGGSTSSAASSSSSTT